jgi:hypothetical protein
MAQNPHEIVAPVPIYSSEHELLSRLSLELQKEREKNFGLARDLALEKHKTQQLECYFLSLSNLKTPKLESEGKTFRKIESSDTFASFSDLNENKIQIGTYSAEVRKEKIRKYKEKVKKYRKSVQVSRVFSGRSVIAKIKPRVNGKFVKSAPVEE